MISKKGLRLVAWVWLGLYACLLLTLTHMPSVPTVFKSQDDKTLHFAAYFVLGGLSFFAAGLTFRNKSILPLAVIIACLVFAAVDESTQPAFGRSADILDWRADAFGIITAVVLMTIIRLLAIVRARSKATST